MNYYDYERIIILLILSIHLAYIENNSYISEMKIFTEKQLKN